MRLIWGVNDIYPWMFYGSGGNFGIGLGLWSMFFGMLIPLALVALVVYLLFRVFKGWGGLSRDGGDLDPLRVLKTRYAKGEITREEFERMKEELKD